VLAAYAFVLLVAYLAVRSSLACDEDLVVDFLLNGSSPPLLEGQLGAYLAGLIEGDGTIYVPTTPRGLDGNLSYPSIKVYFHEHDEPAALALKGLLGHGSVYHVSGEQTVVLSFDTQAGIKDLIDLLNGHLRTPKHDALCRLVDWYRSADPLYQVECLPIDLSPLYTNAWLAGFADADGSFYVYATPKRVSVSFELVQSRVDHALIDRYLPIMQAIATFLLSKLGITLATNLSGSISKRMRARNTALAGAGVAAAYFTRFPLLTSKHLDFVAWRSVYARILVRQAKDGEGLTDVQALKESTNSKRKVFTWDHLKTLYTRR